MLHIIKTSPFSSADTEQCIEYLKPGDIVLFIQDGVITTSNMNKYALSLQQLVDVEIYTLNEDLRARGLTVLLGESIDYTGFVQLTCKEPQIQAW